MFNLFTPIATLHKIIDSGDYIRNLKTTWFQELVDVILDYYYDLSPSRVAGGYKDGILALTIMAPPKAESNQPREDVLEIIDVYLGYKLMVASDQFKNGASSDPDLLASYKDIYEKGFATQDPLYFDPQIIFDAIIHKLLGYNAIDVDSSDEHEVAVACEVDAALRGYQFLLSKQNELIHLIKKDIVGSARLDKLFGYI